MSTYGWIALAMRDPVASVEQVIAHGGRCPVRCRDGFSMSVVAHGGAYCSPRPGWIDGLVPDDYAGPFVALEVGFPSSRPEPWDQWSEWAESPGDPTGTVYGWVPAEAIRALVALHGGEA